MTIPTYIEFRDQMLGAGYDEVLERPWAPGTVVHTHAHPFEADALVVTGEMWLSVNGAPAQHLLPEAWIEDGYLNVFTTKASGATNYSALSTRTTRCLVKTCGL